MKKIVFTLAAMMSMTLAFAEGENSTKTEAAAPEAAKYEINVNVNSLGRTLGLDYDTKETVSFIENEFQDAMRKAGNTADETERTKLYKKAINRNLSYMHTVLNDEQFREYAKLLNATLNNRGLNK